MAKVKNENEKNVIIFFGQELINEKLSNQDLINLIKERFNNENLEIGKLSYFILGLKHLGLIDLSYTNIVLIEKKIFEINNMVTNTTEKCQAWYMQKIKKGLINLENDFSNVGRKKEIININDLKF